MSNAAQTFSNNKEDIIRLLEIHSEIGGPDKGRRVGLEVLNKSAVVLITACWEAFVEDICIEAFDFLLDNCTDFNQFPSDVRLLASEQLRKSDDKRKVWELAGEGWKTVLRDYRDTIIRKFVGTLNTPKSSQVVQLFKSTIGIEDISSNWRWQKQSRDNAISRLDNYVSVRGAIAHRTEVDDESVTKAYVGSYLIFIQSLTEKTEEAINNHLYSLINKNLS